MPVLPRPYHYGRRSTLVMFSGGVDSTYTLVKLLRETDDEVLAHHLNLINPEGRAAIEADRCRRMVDWLKRNVRNFTYSESTIDHRGFRWFGFDIIACGFEAGIVAHSYKIAYGRDLDRWVAGHCAEERSNPERLKHVLACCAANAYPHKVPEFWKPPVVTKAEELAYLPEAIRALVWTCRTPIMTEQQARECGQCDTCKTMQLVRRKKL